MPDTGPGRPVYLYSVIPGGVENAQELQEAIRRDPVARAHYADFDVSHSHIVPLAADELVYVSYRLHNDIFWTKEQIRLHQGEKVITDGVNAARARCGNRISLYRQPKISLYAPPAGVLESPQPPAVVSPTGVEVLPIPPNLPLVSVVAAPGMSPGGSSGGAGQGGFPPGIFFFLPAAGGAGGRKSAPCVPPKNSSETPKSTPCRTTPTAPPSPKTPEPGTVLLFVSGLGYLLHRRKARD